MVSSPWLSTRRQRLNTPDGPRRKTTLALHETSDHLRHEPFAMVARLTASRRKGQGNKRNASAGLKKVRQVVFHLGRLLLWHLLLLFHLWHRRLSLAVNAQVWPAELWEVDVDVAVAICAQRLAPLVLLGLSRLDGVAKLLFRFLHKGP